MPLNKEPILVTGATGFIGSRVVARLVDEDRAVRALVLPGERIVPGWEGRVDVIRGDVTRKDDVERAVDGAAAVVHLAAVVGDWGAEESFERINVGGTERVIEAAVRARTKVVLASSIVVYGDRLGSQTCDEDRPFGRPLGPYSRTKQKQELRALEIGRREGVDVTALRLGNVFGPGSRNWVDEVLVQLRRGVPVLVDGGEKNAGLCYVEHAVDAFLLAAQRTPKHRVYNVNDGSDVTWKRYFGDLARIGRCRPPKSMPRLLGDVIARAGETVLGALRSKTRPPATREAMNIIAADHKVPIARAVADLGFSQRIGYDEAMEHVERYVRSD